MQQVAQGLASLGRGDDKMLVHMTPGEVKGLQSLAMAHGGSLTINPQTGLPEAGFLRAIMPTLLGAGLAATGVGAPMAALMVGGGYGLASGSLKKGLMAGLGAYGGAGIGEGLASMGSNAVNPEMVKEAALLNQGPGVQMPLGGYEGLPGTTVGTAADQLALSPENYAFRESQLGLHEGKSLFPNSDLMTSSTEFIPNGTSFTTAGVNNMASQSLSSGFTTPNTYADNILTTKGVPISQTTYGVPPVSDVIPNSTAGITPGYTAPNPYNPPASTFDKMKAGAQQLNSKQGIKDLYNQPGVGLTGLTSAFAQPVMAAMTPTPVAMPTAETASKSNYPNFNFKQTRNPKFGQPGQPYYTQEYVPMAAGGQIQAPSMPMDLSQNYPGSDISKSSYASLPSTQPQEIVDGYGPKINPFTGAEGMAAGGLAGFNSYGSSDGYNYNPDNQTYSQGAAGADDQTANNIARYLQTPSGQGYSGSGMPDLSNIGINASGPSMVTNGMPPDAINALQHSFLGSNLRTMAKGGSTSGNLADFKMYEGPSDSEVEDLTASQLEAATDSDDPYLMGMASLERDRRKGSGTKGYKRKEFANGGIANTPEYAAGGKLLRGPGDGMSDDIPAVIKGPKPQRAALADGEFVVPADVVSHLGNGSTDAGAKRLYAMLDKVRHARTGNKKQGRQINAERFLPA